MTVPVPPHSLHAEQSLIGAIVMRNDAYWEIPRVTPADFYRAEHVVLWAAIESLAASDRPFDLLTLSTHLESSGQLEAAGGLSYLGAVITETCTAANAVTYAGMVRARAALRRVSSACLDGYHASLDPGADPEAVADDIEARVFQARLQGSETGEPKMVAEILPAVLDALDSRSVGAGYGGTATGLMDIDRLLLGIRAGQLVVLGARPSVGKSAFALTVSLHIAKHSGTVAFFALEMTAAEMTERSLAQLARVSVSRIRAGRLDEAQWTAVADASTDLRALPLILADRSGLRPSDIRAHCRRLARQHGPLSLVVVDHIGLMRSDIRTPNRVQELTQISGALKSLAKELSCPVLALSQLNREVEKRGTMPVLSDLRDSGSIEQDADIVILLHRDTERPTDAIAKLAKNRNGPVGSIPLTFLPELARYESSAGGMAP